MFNRTSGLLRVALTLCMAAGTVVQAQVHPVPVPDEVIDERLTAQTNAADKLKVPTPKQIVFGDTHVHTTYSTDAYLISLPINRSYREGGYPADDACDFARYCSALDFYVLTDHAESFTLQNWNAAKESIRQCNAVAGDPDNPDLVAYMGFEWSQVGRSPDTHYGHKNVMFMGTADDELPMRPIGAAGPATETIRGSATARVAMLGLVDTEHRAQYAEFGKFHRAIQNTPDCPEGVSSLELPENCYESTVTPAGLYEKLDQWGFDTIIIPHGSTWGFYTPPSTTFDKHLRTQGYDPKKQKLIEIFSGHGNSEPYRDWRAIRYDQDGAPYCPEPTQEYLPSCWQAGEIIRERCLASGFEKSECEARAVVARKNFVVEPMVAAFHTVPGAQVEDWLDSGQARDIFEPAFNYRPAESVQYSMAIANFDDPENPLRHRWGFIGSSDNHRARPGTGARQLNRYQWTESGGNRSKKWRDVQGKVPYPIARSITLEEALKSVTGFGLLETERQASFFVTGGLAAVHTEGRSREAIWDAMKRKEVYATSGERILLWFNLLNGPDGDVAMGGDATMNGTPRFSVRAVGAFKQLPGCPDHATSTLDPDRIQDLCAGECYNPSDERKRITRLEIIRIRPQISPDENVGPLIQDPWKIIECEPDEAGCVAEFEDPEFTEGGRDVLYYVRAIEEPSLAINGQNLRTKFDSKGNPISIEPCYGDYRSDPDDNCLSEVEQRAWSSPIFVDFKIS